MLKFTVPGKAKPKQSFEYSYSGRNYTPRDVKEYAQKVKAYFKKAYPQHNPEIFVEKALFCKVVVYRQIPKSYSRIKTMRCIAGDIRPITRPDTDNYTKNIKDALNKVAYPDDSQVVSDRVEKYYSEHPRVEITIGEVK